MFLQTEAAKPGSVAISDIWSEADAGHGRVELRRCLVSDRLDWLTQKPEWSGLRSIAMLEETRDINGKISCDRRFFISSLPANARQIATAVRAHWAAKKHFKGIGIKALRKKAGWGNDNLRLILMKNF